MRYFFFLILSLSFYPYVSAQSHSPFSHSFYANYEKDLHAIGLSHHTSIKPFDLSLNDTLYYRSFDPIKTSKSALYQLFNDHLLSVETMDYAIYLNPLMYFELANDGLYKYVNSRGAEVKGRIGKRITFYSAFHEKQMTLTEHVQDFVFNNQYVVPGQGMAKKPLFYNDSLADFYSANAYVNFHASSFFNFEIGHGKHFFGDGYRSLLLSDNAFNYPYFKITTEFWKLKYVNLFSSLQHIDFNDRPDISKEKMSATHYLSANIGGRLTVSLLSPSCWVKIAWVMYLISTT